MELGQYPSEIDWHLIESETSCDEKCKFLCSAIMTGYNILMPEKRVKIHQNDTPWIIGRTEALNNFAAACFLGTMLCSNKVNKMRNPALKKWGETRDVVKCFSLQFFRARFLRALQQNRAQSRLLYLLIQDRSGFAIKLRLKIMIN